MPSFIDSIKKRWNAFIEGSKEVSKNVDYGRGTNFRPDTSTTWRNYEKSIVTTIYNRIAVDAAAVQLEHVRVDDEERYIETLPTNFNTCLNFSANIDQTGRQFIQDVVMSMFDEGCVAIVATDATSNPNLSASYDILGLRVGRITQWYPQYVKVEVYNEFTGKKEEIITPKIHTAIVTNPFYDIMNRPNSTLKRLKQILNDLDALNKYATSGKLDIIIQLPYTLKSETRLEQANQRRKNLEEQLKNSELGIGYIDSTEKVIQLGRTLENNLWKQAQDLTDMLYSQMGLSPTIFDGTADYNVLNNYYNRVIDPILVAISEAMCRVFISKNARTRGETIKYFRDPFRLIPINELADMADRFTRNEILSSNELRGALGFKPVQDERADELRNKNLNPTDGIYYPSTDNDVNAYNQEQAAEMIEEQPYTDYDVPPEEIAENQ